MVSFLPNPLVTIKNTKIAISAAGFVYALTGSLPSLLIFALKCMYPAVIKPEIIPAHAGSLR